MPRWSALSAHGCEVHHTEHILAAVSICDIDNVYIEMDSNEVPLVSGGSCRTFCDAIRMAGIVEQNEPKMVYRLNASFGEVGGPDREDSCFLGSPHDAFEVSYLFHVSAFEEMPVVAETCEVTDAETMDQIVNARTYLLEHETSSLGELLQDKIQDYLVVGPSAGEASYREAVNHKLLDMIGDLMCLGSRVLGRFTGIRSGHRLNMMAVMHMHREGILEWVPLR